MGSAEALNYIQAACHTTALQGSTPLGLQSATWQVPFNTM